MTVFSGVDGILRSTIQNLFDSTHYQRRSIFLSVFKTCMPNPEASASIVKLLFYLSTAYLVAFNKLISGTTGSVEKRQRAGKNMIFAYESEGVGLQDNFRVKFASLECMRTNFDFSVDTDEWSHQS